MFLLMLFYYIYDSNILNIYMVTIHAMEYKLNFKMLMIINEINHYTILYSLTVSNTKSLLKYNILKLVFFGNLDKLS